MPGDTGTFAVGPRKACIVSRRRGCRYSRRSSGYVRPRDPRCFCIDASKCLLCQRDFGRIAEHLREGFRPHAGEHKDGRGGMRTRAPLAGHGNDSEAPVTSERSVAARCSRVAPRGLS